MAETSKIPEKAFKLDTKENPLSDAEKAVEGDLSPQTASEETEYPGGLALALILTSVLMAMFLVSLDRTIVATAIPRITDDFHSLADIGWYASAYMLTNSSFQLIFGRIYKLYSVKRVFLLAIGLFEVGSIVCGVAPNSTTLIVGRAIAGLGSAGIFSGAMMILVHSIPLHRRPLYSGLFGAIFGISFVVGPLLGGAFTDKVSWRWCFYLNAPVGAFVILVNLFILHVPSVQNRDLSSWKQLAQLDFLGIICFIPSNISLMLALQLGGTTYNWNDGRIIGLLVVFGVLFITFVGIQLWKGDAGTVPPRIIGQRSVGFAVLYSICGTGSMMIFVYYLPVWFQAIKDASAVESGIMTLPIIISLVLGSVVSGATTAQIGYYTPAMITAPILMSIGAGLITTFMPDTGRGKWIGYQVLYGFGLGCGMQAPSLAAQTVLKKEDVSIGVSLIFFSQQFGGAIFVALGQNIFASRLASGLGGIAGLAPNMIANAGATDLKNIVPPELLDRVLSVYNHALTKTFDVGVAVSCVMIIGALGMEWKSIKKNEKQGSEPEVNEPKATQ